MRRAEIGEDALPQIRDGLGGKGEVESPFMWAGKGQEVLLKGWEGSGGPPFGPERARSPSRRSWNGWEALPDGRQESGRPPGGTRWDGRSSRRAGRGQESHPVCLESLPECREGSGGLAAGPGSVGRKLMENPWTRGNLTNVHAAAQKVD